MSFAGHVFDMIRRSKEDRQYLKNFRNRTKEGKDPYKSRVPDISVEEFEEIKRQTKEKKERDERYFRKMMFIVITASLLILLFLVIIFLTSCNGKTSPPDPAEEANQAKAWAYYEEAINTRGISFTEKDSLLKSLSLLDSAISIDPENRAFYFFKHECLTMLGEYAEALQVAKRSEELKPGSPEIKAMVGIDYYLNGDSVSGRMKMLESDSLWNIALDTVNPKNILRYLHILANKASGLKCLGQEEQANAVLEKITGDPVFDEYAEVRNSFDTFFRNNADKDFLEYMLAEIKKSNIFQLSKSQQ